MIKGLPKQFEEVIQRNSNLSRYLFNLTQEVPTTKRSWLYEKEDANKVLSDWKNRLEQLETGDSFEREIFEFETSAEEKFGPQGGHAPIGELYDEIIKPTFEPGSSQDHLVFSEESADPDWTASVKAINNVMQKAGVRGLRPASYLNVVKDMRARFTLESNSGWPDFARRNIPEITEAAIAAASDGSYQNYPAIALIRYYRKKSRLVWMFPMATNLVEGAYYQPLYSAISKANLEFYSPWIGFEKVREVISRAYDEGKVIAASDFSSTDAHFRLATTLQANKVLSQCFSSEEARNGLTNSLVHMHNIPLIIGPDQMVTGDHGVSSGSNWTNFIETVFDQIFSNYVSSKTDYSGLYAIGDDMAWISGRYDEGFDSELEQLGKSVGQIIKSDKTTNYPGKVKTLQRLFQKGYNRPDGLTRGVYPTIRALNSSLYPERFHDSRRWSSDMFCARQFMILENCVDHPLFEQFVEFIVKGQKDLIPFAKKSAPELNRITRESKLLPGLNSTYNQERRESSLANFASIQIARSL